MGPYPVKSPEGIEYVSNAGASDVKLSSLPLHSFLDPLNLEPCFSTVGLTRVLKPFDDQIWFSPVTGARRNHSHCILIVCSRYGLLTSSPDAPNGMSGL